jgi:hypothetical protein
MDTFPVPLEPLKQPIGRTITYFNRIPPVISRRFWQFYSVEKKKTELSKNYFIISPIKIYRMFSKLKINFTVITIAAAFATIIVSAPLTDMFGKHYNKNNDYSCCKNNQMTIHHYYTTRVFWITLGSGYDLEPIGKPSEGCNVACDE